MRNECGITMEALTYRVLIVVLVVSSLLGHTRVNPPHILGLAQVAFRVSNLPTTGLFYEDFMGYAEPFSLSDENGKTSIALVVDLVNFYSKCVPD